MVKLTTFPVIAALLFATPLFVLGGIPTFAMAGDAAPIPAAPIPAAPIPAAPIPAVPIPAAPVPAAPVPAARVLAARGDVQAEIADGTGRDLRTGSSLFSGETIVTGRGEAQIRFSDGGLLTLYRNTRFAIDDYRYFETQADNGHADFTLMGGLIHALTGRIGKKRPENYRLQTSMAVLGLRGTDFWMRLHTELHVGLVEGAVTLTNDAGALLLEAGQTALVENSTTLPRLTTEIVDLIPAGRKGRRPRPSGGPPNRRAPRKSGSGERPLMEGFDGLTETPAQSPFPHRAPVPRPKLTAFDRHKAAGLRAKSPPSSPSPPSPSSPPPPPPPPPTP